MDEKPQPTVSVLFFTLHRTFLTRLCNWGCVGALCWGVAVLGSLRAALSPQAAAVFKESGIHQVESLIQTSIQQSNCPGAVFWVERNGVSFSEAFGSRAVAPKREAMTLDTVFDVASLTKVLATTPCVMLLWERGQLDIESPVQRYIPAFHGEGRDAITLRHLLTHTSGLRSGLPRQNPWRGHEHALALACAEKPETPPGTRFRYSDINFVLLGEVVQRVSGQHLETFAAESIYRPLRMTETGFLPSSELRSRIAPTEFVDGAWLRGVVHDPTARLMGGAAGSAGLFTTIADVARYCRMMVNEGELEGVRLFKAETVRWMTSVATLPEVEVRRGLGWDIDSSYSRPRGQVFPLGSYGHTGFTGTCFWIDPFSKTFWIFLSNRVHPDGKGNILSLQNDLGTWVAQSVRGFNFEQVAGALPARTRTTSDGPADVLNGIDVLERDHFRALRGLRVGLITNHTGQNRQRRSTIDLLFHAEGVHLNALFSPEHGIRGQVDDKVGDGKDEATGLPVYSLFGERRAPTAAQLAGLDALVFDIQDIGCRYYTYISTLGLSMEAAASAGLRFIVLDRVNPVNGLTVEGPVHTNASTFIAFHRLPLRHGMTVGELAQLFRAERGWKLELSVVPCEGWSRWMWYDQTGLPWVSPSPNMRSMQGANLYPALGFLESALSVGRGTESPFQWVGAPYAEDRELAKDLTSLRLPGVQFLPIQFTPSYSTFKGKLCQGVSILVTDRDRFSPVDCGIQIARVLQARYPKEFELEKTRPLLTDGPTIKGIRDGKSLAEIKNGWASELTAFRARRLAYLLYPNSSKSP